MRWDPDNAGIVEKDGVFYEEPRDALPLDSDTSQFHREIFEITRAGKKHILTYYWRAPENPLADRKYPLVMVLHGRPGHPWAAEFLSSPELRKEFPAFIFAPMAPVSRGWAVPEDDPGYAPWVNKQSLPDAVAILRQLMEKNPVDPKRVYVVGCSEGGLGAFAAAARYPDIFAGATALSGTWSPADAAKMTHVPLWIANGGNDPYMPASKVQPLVDALRAHGANIRYTDLTDLGHECPNPVLYPHEMWEWLFRQKKS
jgi:predicted peptidase